MFWHLLKSCPGGKYLTCLTLVQALGDGIHLDFYRKSLKCLKQGMVRFAYWTCGFAAVWRMVSDDGQCQRQGPIWEVVVRASLLTHECSTGYVYGERVGGEMNEPGLGRRGRSRMPLRPLGWVTWSISVLLTSLELGSVWAACEVPRRL